MERVIKLVGLGEIIISELERERKSGFAFAFHPLLLTDWDIIMKWIQFDKKGREYGVWFSLVFAAGRPWLVCGF